MQNQALGQLRYQDRIAVLATDNLIFPIPNVISSFLYPLFSSSSSSSITSSYKERLDLWQAQLLSQISLDGCKWSSSTHKLLVQASKKLPFAIVTFFSRSCFTALKLQYLLHLMPAILAGSEEPAICHPINVWFYFSTS